MGQAYSKAAKRRNKKAQAERAGLPGLAETPKREKNGCFVDRVRQQSPDPHPERTVLTARCRAVGLEPTETNMRAVDAALHSAPAGVAIFLGVSRADERVSLWKTYCDLDRAEDVYSRRILQRPRHAKCGKIEYLPDNVDSENAAPPDGRDEDARDRAAVNAWMHWRGLVGQLPRGERAAIMDALSYRRQLVGDGGTLTDDGRSVIDALRSLTKLETEARR